MFDGKSMSNSVSLAVARQWHIINFLLKANGYTSAALIKEYLETLGVQADLRTIQRDLRSLQMHFPLECNESDRPYSWRWRRLSGAVAHTLSLEQALCVQLIESELKSHIPESILEELKPLLVKARLVIAGQEPSDRFQARLPIDIKDRTLWQTLFGKKSNYELALEQLFDWLNELQLTELASIIKKIDK